MTQDARLFEVEDPRGKKVFCTNTQWIDHIIPPWRDHAELNGHEAGVREAIEKPLAIYTSAKVPGREVYYAYSTIGTYTHLYLRIVVEPNGFVVTAMHVANQEADEVQLWP